MKGVFLHVMADTLGSVGVIISTVLINRYQWTGFDPIASIFIAVLIFASVVPLVIDSAQVLCLELDDEREASVRKALADLPSVEGVSSYSCPRFWPKDPSSIVGSIHIQLVPAPSSHDPSRPHESDHHHDSYVNIDRVVARVETALRRDIPALVELSVQVEGIMSDGSHH